MVRKLKRFVSLLLVFALILTGVMVSTPALVSAASNVKIGQATNDENGGTRGGKAGDQTGKEVSITSWTYGSKSGSYNHWQYVFRAKNPATAQKLADNMIAACKNNHVGYDQTGGQRDSFYDEAKKVGWNIAAVQTDCETTCASVVTVCLNAAGIGTPRYWDSSKVYNDLKSTGLFTIFTDSAHLSSDGLLEPGDILLSPGRHTAMVVSGPRAVGTEFSALLTGNAASTLAAVNIRKPESIAQGSPFSVLGYVQSNYPVTSVTISILNSAGSTVLSNSATTYTTTYDLKGLDSGLKFGSLPAGNYKCRITASDAKKGPVVVHENSFVIVAHSTTAPAPAASTAKPTTSTLTSKNIRLPGAVVQGVGFAVRGSITSDQTITKVDLKILNSSGKTVCSVAATPNSKSYDMANADAAMTFSKLSPGAYRYIVSATDTVQTRIFADQQFSVTAPANPPASQSQVSKSSGISITDTRLPEVLYKGKAFSFWGKLDSSKKMKQVRVQVLNRKGKSVLSASSKPNKKTYNIKKLDKKIRFKKLKRGSYTFRVRVRTSSGWTTVVTQPFAVK